uniref:Uncharacterized protein n=1 Tax=Tetradesmus obliquus TaxID=3088 RepID=A0A383VPI9_TETOB|eukprot:jgi/Sobl393_1/10720/SZX67447.1
MEKAMLVRLGKHLGYVKAQARKLEEENRHLHARESILLAYCHLLSWMRQQECHEWSVLAGLDSEQQQQDGFLLASDTEQFSKDELQLLQQLQSSPLEGMAASGEPMLPQALMQQQQQQQQQQHDGPGQLCSRGAAEACSTETQRWQQKLPATAAAGCRASVGWQQSGSSNPSILTDSSGRGPATSAAAAAAAAGPSVQQEPTVAPDDDLLYYFRRIFSLPPYPGAADMTMQDVSTHYNEVVRELSLNLALHDAAQRHATEAGGAGEWPLAGYKPWQNIRAAFDRLANNFVTLTQMQRDSMHMLAVLVNHADLSQPLLQEPNLDDHIRCVRQMGLSAAQKQQIADGYAVFSQLLQPVLLGMRQLQLQQPGDSAAAAAAAAGDAAVGSSGGNNNSASTHIADALNGRSAAACSGASGSSAHSTAAAPVPAPTAAACSSSFATLSLEGYKMHREVLHQQEQRTAQLKQLMKKHVLTQLALCGYMMGRCTYTQLARLYVLMYPRQPSTAALGSAVVAILKEDQAQLSTGPGAGQ